VEATDPESLPALTPSTLHFQSHPPPVPPPPGKLLSSLRFYICTVWSTLTLARGAHIGPAKTMLFQSIEQKTWHQKQAVSKLSLSFVLFETGSHYVAQAGLELLILLAQPAECWDYSIYHHVWLSCFLFKSV
jgi:hypothetical protein